MRRLFESRKLSGANWIKSSLHYLSHCIMKAGQDTDEYKIKASKVLKLLISWNRKQWRYCRLKETNKSRLVGYWAAAIRRSWCHFHSGAHDNPEATLNKPTIHVIWRWPGLQSLSSQHAALLNSNTTLSRSDKDPVIATSDAVFEMKMGCLFFLYDSATSVLFSIWLFK